MIGDNGGIHYFVHAGVQRSNLCRNEELRCHPILSMGCVDYAEESFCHCRGGFASQICSSSADSNKDSKKTCMTPLWRCTNAPCMSISYGIFCRLFRQWEERGRQTEHLDMHSWHSLADFQINPTG